MTPASVPDGLLTTRQAADLVGVTPQAVRKWQHSGRLPVAYEDPTPARGQGSYYYRPEDVIAASTAPLSRAIAQEWGRQGGRPRK